MNVYKYLGMLLVIFYCGCIEESISTFGQKRETILDS